jgi:hypothetical protein
MDSRIADQLFEVFVALMKRIEDAPTAPFQKECESQLRVELDKYLSLRIPGYSAPRTKKKPKTVTKSNRPSWDRPSRLLTVDGKKRVSFTRREAPTQFAVLDLLEKRGWPPAGVEVPCNFLGSPKDAVEALNERLASTRLRIRLHGNNRRNNRHLDWTVADR